VVFGMSYENYLNQITQNSGFSPADRVLSDTLYGNNMVGRFAPNLLNTENHGFTFFTKPDLNLSYDNLQIDRPMSNLLMEAPSGIQRALRSYMDPEAHRNGLACENVDPLNPFIPLLGNNLVSISGWEDFTLGTFTSDPGLYREVYTYVDDVPYMYGSFDLQCTFRNIIGDPITFMLLLWERYQGLAREGRIMPYPDNVLYNVIDYNTRIYRIVTDVTKTYVTRLFACGASYPITAGLAQHADFDDSGNNSPFPGIGDNITFVFKAVGFTYYDHILIYEFNELQEEFNPAMGDDKRSTSMVKLKPYEREYFNHKGSYPRIEPATMELEWWVFKEVYESRKAGVLRVDIPTTETSVAATPPTLQQ
jgi:hypothetical protein